MLGGDGRANTKKEVNAIRKLGSICPTGATDSPAWAPFRHRAYRVTPFN